MTPYERTARASAGAMLKVERDALVDLRREVRSTLGELVLTVGGLWPRSENADARVHALASVGTATKDVSARVARGIRSARSAARDAALARLKAETLAAGVDVASPARSDGAEDAGLSDMTGASYAAAWGGAMMREVVRWTNDGTTPRLVAVSLAQDHRLARIAATEVSQAYSDEHAEAALELARLYPALKGRLWRRWDAMLDRHLCPVCKAMDGQVVPLGKPFFDIARKKKLEPGFVHPLCRCIEVVFDDAPVVRPILPPPETRPALSPKVFAKTPGVFAARPGYRGGGGRSGGGGSTDSF